MPAVALGREMIAALTAAGVRELVLCPGSRNAPLAFAAHDAAVAGRLRLHTRIDERTAAFLALGLTKVGARAAVVCTSGTAVANLMPAVMEAAHAGLPLVAMTADRPARMRGTSSSQTTDQVGLFGDFAACVDVADLQDLGAATMLLRQGGANHAPVQLNVQLDGGLVPETVAAGSPGTDRVEPDNALAPTPPGCEVHADEASIVLPRGARTVVIAGDDAGPAARALAEEGGWPLLAEPSSGARTGDHALRCYRLLLDGELGAQVERAVVFGRPTLSRPVMRLLGRSDVEVLARSEQHFWSDRPWPVAGTFTSVSVEGAESADLSWLQQWQRADRSVAQQLDAVLAAGPDLSAHRAAAVVASAVEPRALLWIGASNPIRDLDLMMRPYPPRERRRIVASRGVAGIDGTLSSAIGAALGRPHSSRNIAMVGDVTFLHDLTALVIGPQEPRPDLTIVVINDDGGSIFHLLEQGAPELSSAYERLFGTPHGTDLAAVCAAHRIPHWRVESLLELEHALSSPADGIEVIEVSVARDQRRELDERLRALRP